MKSFYEMMMFMEDDMSEKGGQPGGQEIPQEQGPQDAPEGLGDEGSPLCDDRSRMLAALERRRISAG